MNRKITAIAATTAVILLAGTAHATMHNTAFSGFASTEYLINNTSSPGTEKSFSTTGELDVTGKQNALSGRIDLDITDSNTVLEQAFFSWQATEMFSLSGGRINNPLGMEAEDKPNLQGTITHGLIYKEFNKQTRLPGNTVEGVVASIDMPGSPVVNIGILDEPHGVAEKNAYIVNVDTILAKDWHLEATFLAQEDPIDAALISAGDTGNINGLSIGNLFDFHVQYTPGSAAMRRLSLAAEVTSANKVFDLMWGVNGTFAVNDQVHVTARYERLGFASLPTSNPSISLQKSDLTQLTLAGGIALSDNLELLLEYSARNNGTFKVDTSLLEFIITLGDFQ